MKRLVALICIMCALFALTSCQLNDIKLNTEDSFFSSFTVENDQVYLCCTLSIVNQSEDTKSVKIKATFEDDAKNGLLKDAIVDGYSSNNDELFALKKGENLVDVVFIGDYAGTAKKSDRLLPDIDIIEIE